LRHWAENEGSDDDKSRAMDHGQIYRRNLAVGQLEKLRLGETASARRHGHGKRMNAVGGEEAMPIAGIAASENSSLNQN